MFSKIIQWIKEIWSKMIGQSSIKQALKVDIAISAPMAEALQKWSAMYANQAPWLNDYVKSLNLPASIAGEIARAVTIEMHVELSGSARAEWLQTQLDRVLSKIREQVEYGNAKGGMVTKPYITGKEIAVDFVQADMFYPIAFDANGRITSIIFADQRTVGDKFYTRLEWHHMVAEGCEITNRAFRSDSRETLGQAVDLASVGDWAMLLPDAIITNVTRPLYGYFRYPQANNIDPTSPLGVSCYGRAVDLIEQADRLYSDLLWEFESGRRAIYVDDVAFKSEDGKRYLTDKRLYRKISATSDIGDSNKLFEGWTPEFRDASITSGLNTLLKRIEFACSLAYGVLSDPQAIEKTATELKVSQQRSYATVTDTQKALQTALDDLLYAMDIWATLGKLAPVGEFQAVYDFDDSVVVDKDAQWSKDTQAIGLGVMGKVEFRMRNYGEDEATAKKKIADAQAEMPQEEEGAFGGK